MEKSSVAIIGVVESHTIPYVEESEWILKNRSRVLNTHVENTFLRMEVLMN